MLSKEKKKKKKNFFTLHQYKHQPDAQKLSLNSTITITHK